IVAPRFCHLKWLAGEQFFHSYSCPNFRNQHIFHPSFALGAVLIAVGSGSVLLAQDQPAAGSPPPAAAQASQAATSPAPPPGEPPQRAPDPQRQARMLARRLALTPEQQSRVEAILANRLQEIQSVRSDATLDPMVRRATVRSIFRVSDGKINALLNDTQKQLYAQLKQERKERKARMRRGGTPPNEQIQNQN
ncbi:MAG: hypothetical protein ACP5FH_10960, partial [Terracidiphilus sp.]